jgi:YgiT-type zinc finger domain-containing protein
MICDNCGKRSARIRRVTRVYGKGRSAYLIEGVPVVSCGACGECYLTAKTLEKLERIHQRWRKLAVKRLVPVASFGGAA